MLMSKIVNNDDSKDSPIHNYGITINLQHNESHFCSILNVTFVILELRGKHLPLMCSYNITEINGENITYRDLLYNFNEGLHPL